jgi:Tfp pilus assembly protein PilO
VTKSDKKQSQTGIVVAIIAGFLLVMAGGWFAVVSPKRHAADQAAVRIDQMNAQIQKDQTAANEAKSTKPIRVADLFRLTKAMPDRTNMADIVLELSHVADESGITFQSIQPTAPVAMTGYEVVPIDLIFQGNFYDLSDFVYRLRNMVGVYDGKLDATGRLFTIDKVSLGEGDNKFPQLAANLTVDAYVYGATGTAPATAAPTTTDGSTTTGSTDTTATTTTDTGATATPSVPTPGSPGMTG